MSLKAGFSVVGETPDGELLAHKPLAGTAV